MFKPRYLIGLAALAAIAAFCASVTKAEGLNLPPISAVGGGTGTSTAPGYGQLFIGGKSGELEFVASSTIGGVNSIFGRKGAVTAQSGDYTTSLVTEGSNLYFTNARVDAEIEASSSIPRFSPATYGKIFVSNGTAWTAVSTSTLGVSALDLTGVLPVSKGGLNLSSAPAYGQIPVGTVSGGYSLTATSSLGLPTFSGTNSWTGTNTFSATTTLPVQDKGGQVYNVKAYGAKGDGVTDDTEAIRSVINLQQSTCGIVFFPAGTYLVGTGSHSSGPSFVPAPNNGTGNATCDLVIWGAGMYAASITESTSTPIFGYSYPGGGFPVVSRLVVSDITLDGNYSGVAGGAVAQPASEGATWGMISLPYPFTSASGSGQPNGLLQTFTRVRFYRAPSFTFQPTTARIDNSIFDSDGQPDLATSSVHWDILGSSGTQSVVTNSTYVNSAGNYADFVSAATGTVPRLTFIGNRSYNHQLGGIYALGQYSVISNNDLHNNYPGSGVDYDSSTVAGNRGENTVTNNVLENISVPTMFNDQKYGDVVAGNTSSTTGATVNGYDFYSDVGINTSNPQSVLHVNTLSNGDDVIISNHTNAVGALMGIEFRVGDGASTLGRMNAIQSLLVQNPDTSTGADLLFETANNGAFREQMRLANSGFVGVGTSSPFARLSIELNANDFKTTTTAFAIASTTATATTTLFSISNTGTTTIANGVNITAGCFAQNGSCLSFSNLSGTVSNAQLANSSLTVSAGGGLSGGGSVPLGGSASLSLNLASANSWTGLQSFADASSTLATLNTAWLSGISGSLLSTDQNGKIVATSTIGTNLLTGTVSIANGGTNAGSFSAGKLLSFDGVSFVSTSTIGNGQLANSSVTVNTTSPLSGGGSLSLGSALTLSCPACNTTTYTAAYPVMLSAGAFSLAFGTTTANTWSSLQTLSSGFVSQASSTVVGAFTATGAAVFGSSLAASGNITDTGGTLSLINGNNLLTLGSNYFSFGTTQSLGFRFITGWGSANTQGLTIAPNATVGIGTSTPAYTLDLYGGGLRLAPGGAGQPSCSATARGLFWVTNGAAGVKDTVQVCAKDASDAYAWRTIY